MNAIHKYGDYTKEKRDYYEKMLRLLGSLSKLFSENDIPYLDSRIAENLYCISFNAENKGRKDSSVDAVYGNTGIGIKTFMSNGLQKIAEFNKDLLEFSSLKPLEKAKHISKLRNGRIEFTKRNYGIIFTQYHCIRREKESMFICESPMELVDIDNIKISKSNGKTIKFSDGKNEYTFNISKSVLLMRFPKRNIASHLIIRILDNPFNFLEGAVLKDEKKILKAIGVEYQHIFLPLYSIEKGKKIVSKRSGLNQWNAKGRKRNSNEVYFGIPHWIHEKFPGFFPDRNVKFNLKLPDRNILSAKVCQDCNKALMSNPNKALGEWILRDVLQLKVGELLTYKMLQELGIDSVIIQKTGPLEYSIDFSEEGEYEKFKETYLEK